MGCAHKRDNPVGGRCPAGRWRGRPRAGPPSTRGADRGRRRGARAAPRRSASWTRKSTNAGLSIEWDPTLGESSRRRRRCVGGTTRRARRARPRSWLGLRRARAPRAASPGATGNWSAAKRSAVSGPSTAWYAPSSRFVAAGAQLAQVAPGEQLPRVAREHDHHRVAAELVLVADVVGVHRRP